MDGGSNSNMDRENKNGNNVELVYKPLTHEKCNWELLIADDTNGPKESLFLYFSALTANLVIFAAHCTFVWSSPAFQKLKSTDLEVNPLGLPLTPIQESWIAALPCLGSAVGPVLLGKFADTYGRKKGLMLLAVLKAVSYVILAFATNIYLYYLTRFVLGIGVGLSYGVLPVYIGEICESHNRGKFGCIMIVFATLGTLYTLSIAPLLSLKMFSLTCAIPLIFVFVSFVLIIPESPVYLASIGDKDNAIKALMKLRNKTRRIAEKDLHEIIKMTDEVSSSSGGGYLEIFKTPMFRKGMIISIGLGVFQQFSGVNALLAFIGPIFELSGTDISANLSSILVAVVQVIIILVASRLIEKLGRKLLLIISIIGSSISLSVLGIFFYLKDHDFYYIQSIFWLPVTSLIVYIIFFNFGLGSVPWIIISEIFPPSVRSTAASIACIFFALTAFLVTFVFPLVIECAGMAGCCWLFGGFCALGTIFMYTMVPETKGKTIGEIQKILSK